MKLMNVAELVWRLRTEKLRDLTSIPRVCSIARAGIAPGFLAWGTVCLAALATAPSAALAQCDPVWSDQFALRGVVGTIYASASWNDGTGLKTYVAGDFNRLDDIPYTGITTGTHSIAAWNGTRWNTLGLGIGPSGIGQPGEKIVNALAVFDPDGTGPAAEALYAAGSFLRAGGLVANGVAKWNGTAWSAVGTGISSLTNTIPFSTLGVRSMVVFDADGPGPGLPQLYIAGDFQKVGTSIIVNGVARWTGTAWSTVGGAFPTQTRGQKLAVFDDDGPGSNPPALYLGGLFTAVPNGSGGTIPSLGLAKWNGTAWSDVPGIDVNRTTLQGVTSLAAFDDGANRSFWVSGELSITGGTAAPQIVRLEGGTWTSLTTPSTQYPLASAMSQVGSHMIIGCLLGLPPTPFAYDVLIGRWSPASPDSMERLGSLFNNAPSALRFIGSVDFDGPGPAPTKALVSGGFSFIDQQAFSGTAVFNGTAFEPTPTMGSASLGMGLPRQSHPLSVDVLRTLDPDGSGPMPEALFIGGKFWGAGPEVAINAAKFDGTLFTGFRLPINAGGDPTDPNEFQYMDFPTDFATFDDGSGTRVYGCTDPQISGSRIMRLDGTVFTDLAYVDGFPRRLRSCNDGSGEALWLFGSFASLTTTPANVTTTANGAARFRPGTGWEAADAGLLAGDSIYSVVVYDPGTGPTLFAVAYNTNNFTYRLIRWTGTLWDSSFAPVLTATGSSAGFGTVEVFNGSLYVTGHFDSVNGIPAAGIARWNGADWSALGDGLTHTSGPASVSGGLMIVHDDGTGPALYVSGTFTHAGGVPAANTAKWNGSSWSAAGLPANNNTGGYTATAMASLGGKLYFGGGFTSWGGYSASGLTSLGRPCVPCPADFNGDTVVDFFDYLDFVDAFSANNPSADFNGDTVIDFFDYLDFVDAFSTGC